MRSSRSVGGVCAQLAVPANWAAPTATRATKPKLRVMAASTALRPTISRSLAGPAFLDVAKSCGNPNFLPAPSLPRLEFKSGDFKPELIAPSACPRSVGRTAGVGDQPRRCCRGPKRAPIVGIATGLIGHAQHRLDRRPLRGVLCRAIDLGERVFANFLISYSK